MATGAPMATATDPVLILAQWFSPAYPVGAFAYSHGLETAIAAGRIAGPGDLQDWLTDILRHGAGRADALFLAAACRAKNTETLSEIDALNRAFQPSAERLMETDLQGAAFAEATNAIWGTALPRLTYPVAVGRAARLRDLPPDRTAQLYLQAFTANLVGAGMRALPLGQTEGQRIIHRLTPVCAEMAEASRDGDLDALSSTAFLADIAAMRHETLATRIFRS
jgi:urease accessory protein